MGKLKETTESSTIMYRAQPMRATGNRQPKASQMHIQKRERNFQRDECQRAVKKAKLDQKLTVTQPVTNSEVIVDERYGKLILALVSSNMFQAFLKRWTQKTRSEKLVRKESIKISVTPVRGSAGSSSCLLVEPQKPSESMPETD